MRAAVLGRPVSHSLSPILHRAAYTALGLGDWTYDALDIGAEDLPELLAQTAEPLVRLLGAANTLVRTDQGWRAENTDVTGVGMALQLAGVERVGHAAILGAGGTAAAAAVALSSLGAQHVDVVVRDPARAEDVIRVLGVLNVSASVISLADAEVDAPLVVSTVPIDAQPALLPLDWRAEHTVLDVLYAPWPTPLAQRVTAAGGSVVGGLEVLFWQATVQVELMTGRPAPIMAMRSALDAAAGVS
jgi:shikimate dehydrogenase